MIINTLYLFIFDFWLQKSPHHDISSSPYRLTHKHTCTHTHPNVSGYFFINGCMLFPPRGYQDHMETLDQRALRESRSAPFEQLLLTSLCTSAVTFTFPFMISLNKRLELYHLCSTEACLSGNRPLCEQVFPIITVHQHRDEPSAKKSHYRFS